MFILLLVVMSCLWLGGMYLALGWTGLIVAVLVSIILAPFTGRYIKHQGE